MKTVKTAESLIVIAVLLTLTIAPAVNAAPGASGSDINSQLAQARQATTKYHDVTVALADGYAPLSPHIPNMGAHYANFGLIDGLFDPAQPEVLLYSLEEGDGPKLVGVEYAATGAAPPEGFTGSSDEWELHEAMCHYADGYEEAQPAPFLCPPTSPGGAPLDFWHPDMWALHVWLWRANPDGIFEDFNPNVP